jgi:hypothetical protein
MWTRDDLSHSAILARETASVLGYDRQILLKHHA